MPIFSHTFSGLFMPKNNSKPEPVAIQDALGRFTLDKENFCGEVTLLGRKISVFLETDGEGTTTADAALNNLHAFAPKAEEWDAAIKKSAADDFAGKDGTVETWGGCDSDSEGEPISKEEFMNRIAMNFIQFYRDGSLFFDYDLDDMFTDHGLGVHADISGRIASCALWG
ncbi:MAG: DUF2262 domain-containing protein [Clostridia bacterium]|nr:DUF2262 domain-containing protein [Clostridia bacterium]